MDPTHHQQAPIVIELLKPHIPTPHAQGLFLASEIREGLFDLSNTSNDDIHLGRAALSLVYQQTKTLYENAEATLEVVFQRHREIVEESNASEERLEKASNIYSIAAWYIDTLAFQIRVLYFREQCDRKMRYGIGPYLEAQRRDLVPRFWLALVNLLKKFGREAEAEEEADEWWRREKEAWQEVYRCGGECLDRYAEFHELRAVCLDVGREMRLWIDFRDDASLLEWL